METECAVPPSSPCRAADLVRFRLIPVGGAMFLPGPRSPVRGHILSPTSWQQRPETRDLREPPDILEGLDHGGDKDTLRGDDGDDDIWGGTGDDEMWGGAGNDELYGGAGRDRFYFAEGGGQTDTIKDFSAGEDCLVFDHSMKGNVTVYYIDDSEYKST